MCWRRQVGATMRYSECCEAINDEMLWVLNLIRDTDMRLSESTAVHKDDKIPDVSIP